MKIADNNRIIHYNLVTFSYCIPKFKIKSQKLRFSYKNVNFIIKTSEEDFEKIFFKDAENVFLFNLTVLNAYLSAYLTPLFWFFRLSRREVM